MVKKSVSAWHIWFLCLTTQASPVENCCMLIIITTQRRRKTSEDFFRKICTSHFIVRIRKGVTQGFIVRGSWRPNRTAIYLPPLLWPSALCLSRSPGLLNRRARRPALCWMMAFFIESYHQLVWSSNSIGVPEGPFGRLWLSLPHLVYNYVRSLTSTVWHLVLTEIYNSSTPTQSPTQSLEWHVWSSSSGKNCHAVQRSLSSGVSVYECTMGFLPCPISSAKYAYAISTHNCHWNVSLPSGASLWNGKFGRDEGQNTTKWPYISRSSSSILNILLISNQLYFIIIEKHQWIKWLIWIQVCWKKYEQKQYSVRLHTELRIHNIYRVTK